MKSTPASLGMNRRLDVVRDAMARARAANAAANYKACEKALVEVRRILAH